MCIMPVSLYSQQSCSFVVTPVLVTQNASKLVIIGLNKNIVDYSRSACKFWKVQTITVEDLEGASWLPLALGRRTDAVTHGTPNCDSGTVLGPFHTDANYSRERVFTLTRVIR